MRHLTVIWAVVVAWLLNGCWLISNKEICEHDYENGAPLSDDCRDLLGVYSTTEPDGDADTDADSDSDSDTDSVTSTETAVAVESSETGSTAFTGETGIVMTTGHTGETGVYIDPRDVDDDGDLFAENEGDCNDSESMVFPGQVEIANDGVDQDCNGSDVTHGCGGGFGVVSGSFIAPVGATIVSLSGARAPWVGVDDQIIWSQWSSGAPADMMVTLSGNVAGFTFDRCVDGAATWSAAVAYTLPGVPAMQYDCQSSNFTGSWYVQFDAVTKTVTEDITNVLTGACRASW